MINPFIIKKYASLILGGFIPVICFYIGLTFYSFTIGMILLFVGILVGVIVGSALLSNPFSQLVEGKGILTLNIDSTGIIRPFIVKVSSPYIFWKSKRQIKTDTFDRSATLHIAKPKTINKPVEFKKDGKIVIELPEKEYNDGRFALFHYPCLIWNDQINSILTKDFLGGQEKEAFAEHGVLYLNRKMEDLTSAIRDFGRHVVETTKPKANFFESKLFWIVIIIAGIILLILFLPALIDTFSSGMGAVGDSIKTAADGAVTPR